MRYLNRRAILENDPRPINENDPCWAALAEYFRIVLSQPQQEGWHELRVTVRRQADGSVQLYLPTLKELS